MQPARVFSASPPEIILPLPFPTETMFLEFSYRADARCPLLHKRPRSSPVKARMLVLSLILVLAPVLIGVVILITQPTNEPDTTQKDQRRVRVPVDSSIPIDRLF